MYGIFSYKTQQFGNKVENFETMPQALEFLTDMVEIFIKGGCEITMKENGFTATYKQKEFSYFVEPLMPKNK